MKMYDIVVNGRIVQICGTYKTALQYKNKYGNAKVKIVERDIKK